MAAVNGGSEGQRRRSTMVNGSGPPLTTVRPPPDHRRTTARPPPDPRQTAGQPPLIASQRRVNSRVWIGSGLGPPRGTMCQLTWQLTWHGGDKPSCVSRPPWIGPDFEASRACSFVLRSLELQSSASLLEFNI
ncbi:hypothetical protein Tco_0928152 [Tanacetum coccineum]